jgi:tripartite-type tricarboxylate transporter receptor subunit TctC
MKLTFAAAAVLLAAGSANGASAENYPNKPVRLIVPYAAGGGVDILGRIVASKLTESLGAQVIVDNRAGGGTIIGTEAVAKAVPDGYTLLFTNAALTASPALNEKLPFDPVKSFAPVAMVAGSYNVLIVHPSLPVKTVKDMVALAKSKPGQLNYASGGVGSAIHLAMELFASRANIDVVHIPYKGAGPALFSARRTDDRGERLSGLRSEQLVWHARACQHAARARDAAQYGGERAARDA